MYDYQRIKEKIYINRGAGTSELLKDKQSSDLEAKELTRLFKTERATRLFDEEEVILEDLTIQQRLIHLGLAENGHIFKGTFLCLGKRNQIQTISHSATESKFIVFKGTERTHILALETLNGNIIQQYEKMMMLLRTHIPLGRDREKNEDIYEIPMIALREFVTNAFVHRNYSHTVQSYIQIEIYDDRIEIKSPGHLPPTVNVHKIEGTVFVNPTIAAIFHLYQYIERGGTGINTAQTALKEHRLASATIENIDSPTMVKVTIQRNVYVPNGNGKTRTIPRFLTQNPFISEIVVGFEVDLAAIKKQLFEENIPLLFINGQAGVGKTMFAAQYYNTFQNAYTHTAWVSNEGNIAQALLSHLTEPLGLNFNNNATESERLEILLRGLANLEKLCLLVIDGVDDLADLEKNYTYLRRCPNVHLLLTTRLAAFNHATFYTVKSLSESEALILFKSYYSKLKANETPLFAQIYAIVDGNTLILELLAKNIFLFNRLRQHYTLSDVLTDLQTKGILALSKTQNVQVDYHAKNNIREAKPEDIIETMYDLSELTPSETTLLGIFAGLHTDFPIEKISFETLESVLPKGTQIDLEKNLLNLVQKGWIEHDESAETFRCNPIIQAIVRKKEKATPQ